MSKSTPYSRYVGVVAIGQVTRDEIYDTMDVLPQDQPNVTPQHTRIGGKAFNQAVAAARMCARVSLVSAVGTDPAAKDIKHSLEKEGIHNDYLITCSAGRQVVESVIVRLQDVPRGERKVIVRQPPQFGRCYDMALERARPAILDADIVIVTFELGAKALSSVWKSLRQLKKHNPSALVILNPAPEISDVKSVVKGLRYADIVIPNRWEARALVDRSQQLTEVGIAHEISEMYGAQNVCITLGAEGAVWASGEKSGVIPGLEVDLVDKVAASDVFTGVLGIAFWQSHDFESSVRLANIAAAMAVGKQGGADSAPTLIELRDNCRTLDQRDPSPSLVGPTVMKLVDNLVKMSGQE